MKIVLSQGEWVGEVSPENIRWWWICRKRVGFIREDVYLSHLQMVLKGANCFLKLMVISQKDIFCRGNGFHEDFLLCLGKCSRSVMEWDCENFGYKHTHLYTPNLLLVSWTIDSCFNCRNFIIFSSTACKHSRFLEQYSICSTVTAVKSEKHLSRVEAPHSMVSFKQRRVFATVFPTATPYEDVCMQALFISGQQTLLRQWHSLPLVPQFAFQNEHFWRKHFVGFLLIDVRKFDVPTSRLFPWCCQ